MFILPLFAISSKVKIEGWFSQNCIFCKANFQKFSFQKRTLEDSKGHQLTKRHKEYKKFINVCKSNEKKKKKIQYKDPFRMTKQQHTWQIKKLSWICVETMYWMYWNMSTHKYNVRSSVSRAHIHCLFAHQYNGLTYDSCTSLQSSLPWFQSTSIKTLLAKSWFALSSLETDVLTFHSVLQSVFHTEQCVRAHALQKQWQNMTELVF